MSNARRIFFSDRLNHFGAGFDGDSQPFLGGRTTAFAQAERLEFEMMQIFEAGIFKRVLGAIERAAVNGNNVIGFFSFHQQRFDAAADTGETGHFAEFFFRQRARGMVGQFSGVGAAGARVNHNSFCAILLFEFIHSIRSLKARA